MGIYFPLMAEGMEMDINRARIVVKLLSPYAVQDILARVDSVGVLTGQK
jgi:hypothetical protein